MRPLRTLDPAGPTDDLAWLDETVGDARVTVGDARVVAIGESAHYNRESYQLRHRLLRYLVERHGFGAYAMESGFVEGWLVDDWVRGGANQLGEVMANGMTSLMGLWTEMRAHLEWMRQHNHAAHPADRLGGDYLVIGTTNGTGQTLNTGADFYAGKLFTDLQPPQPGSLDALMAASGDRPFATDLQRLSPAGHRNRSGPLPAAPRHLLLRRESPRRLRRHHPPPLPHRSRARQRRPHQLAPRRAERILPTEAAVTPTLPLYVPGEWGCEL